jgi:hypothetical protein
MGSAVEWPVDFGSNLIEVRLGRDEANGALVPSCEAMNNSVI